jgi:hypothetical protein
LGGCRVVYGDGPGGVDFVVWCALRWILHNG